jgi:hypothetical protein
MSDNDRRTQLVENMRFYADMRFKQLTLLSGGLTLIAAGLVEYESKMLTPTVSVRSALLAFALIFTGVLWTMEVRSSLYWIAHRSAAADAWPEFHLPRWIWLNAANAVLGLHIVLYVGWLYLAWTWKIPLAVTAIFTVFGVVLLVFSCDAYWSAYQEFKRAERPRRAT